MRLPFFGQLSIRQWWWMIGVGKSWQRLTKVVITVACNRWSQWSIGSSNVRSLNKGDSMLLTSCGNSLPKDVTLVCYNHFLWCNASLVNLCARQWSDLVISSLSWGVVFRGSLFGANGMIWFLMLYNGPLRKHVKLFGTRCRIIVVLSGNGLSRTWKRTRTLLTKMSLTNSIRSEGSKVLLSPIATLWSRGRLGS